jgi:hypothetical protein
MCVWQSHAPGGTSKFTGVCGCDALADADAPGRTNAAVAAAAIPISSSRRDTK